LKGYPQLSHTSSPELIERLSATADSGRRVPIRLVVVASIRFSLCQKP
jgi:hypothetical protein